VSALTGQPAGAGQAGSTDKAAGNSQPGQHFEVVLHRLGTGHYQATNADGASVEVGGPGNLSPVELLLAALGGCTSVDVDVVTARRAQADKFEVAVSGDKITEPDGGHLMANLGVDFRLHFAGERAAEATGMLERLIKLSHERDCTVSRTVERGVGVSMSLDGEPVAGPQRASGPETA